MKSSIVPLERYRLLGGFGNGHEIVEADEAPRVSRRWFLVSSAATAAFTWGVGVGYLIWGRNTAEVLPAVTAAVPTATPTPPQQIQLPHSYTVKAVYGDIGPKLLEHGAFAYDAFAQVYQQAGKPLTAEQRDIVREGHSAPITIDHANAYFLLNLFWALGLANTNPILTSGLMTEYSNGQIERFASTGGWSLAAKPVQELFASAPIITLSDEQQARLEEVASGVFRPCCDNPTIFPDCNHGMAMLGLLELMAAQDATVDEMFDAAKYVNSFWFPAQAQEVAAFYWARTGTDFAQSDSRAAVGPERFSNRGFAAVHQWLAENGKLEQGPQNGNSCGV